MGKANNPVGPTLCRTDMREQRLVPKLQDSGVRIETPQKLVYRSVPDSVADTY